MRELRSDAHSTTNRAKSPRTEMPLASAPCGVRARVCANGSDVAQSEALAAMGVIPDEVIVVHRSGEPTIVSLGGWRGRRIGLSARTARTLIVSIED